MNKIERFKKFGLLLIGILTFQLAFSQENYIPGYVIKKSTDTLFGYIDYRNWKKNPDKIYFKTNIESNPISFNPIDIIEFKVEGEIYVSGIINTEVSPTRTDMLNDDPQINIKVDTTFLQTLFRGKKSLYYHKNSNGKENFYIKQNTGFDLLIYKRYLKQQDGKRVIIEYRKYLGQLTLYLNDCETINSKLENTSYKQKSLIELFQYYYKCSQSNISFQKEIEKIHTEIGVLAGVSLTSLEFHSDAFAYLVEAGYNPSINFSCGIFFDFILPRNQGKWSINNEILFSTYKVMGSYEEYENENYYSVTTTEFGYSYLKINNLVRFKYPIGHLFLFLNGGISNGFAINETNYKKKESKFYTTERDVEELALNDTRKYEQGFILGTGLKYNSFSLEIRYEKGNGMSEYMVLNSSTKRIYFLLGYRF
jgi:hypothetical protein